MADATREVKLQICRRLDAEYAQLDRNYRRERPPRGTIPVGGAFMDLFFKMESVLGAIAALRENRSLAAATKAGCERAELAVRLWNSHREFQVRRWEKTANNYLEDLMRRLVRECRTG